jgi:hypothetical protein
VYSGVGKSIEFAANEGAFFWSNGYSWGSVTMRKAIDKMEIELKVLFGELEFKSFAVKGYSPFYAKQAVKIECGGSSSMVLKSQFPKEPKK